MSNILRYFKISLLSFVFLQSSIRSLLFETNSSSGHSFSSDSRYIFEKENVLLTENGLIDFPDIMYYNYKEYYDYVYISKYWIFSGFENKLIILIYELLRRLGKNNKIQKK